MPSQRCFVFDLDGTIYLGDTPIEGAVEAVNQLKSRGNLVLYMTNNSSQTIDQYVSKLRDMGLDAQQEDMLTSGSATAYFLTARQWNSVFVVGEDGLVETLRSAGIECATYGDIDRWREDLRTDAVVVGICRDTLSYALIEHAANLVRAGAPLIATNRDATFPDGNQRVCPGAGAIVAAIEIASGVTASVIGKPSPFILLDGLERRRIPIGTVVVVGDRVDTDIECGLAAGAETVLVTTGIDRTAPEGVRVIATLAELLAL